MKKYEVLLEDVPSENTLYPTNFKTGMRFLSKKGSEFRQRASLAFKIAQLPKFKMKPLIMEVHIYWRTMRRADPMNFLKAVGDSLKYCGYIEDDWIIVPRVMKFYYPDHPDRKVLKGIQCLMLTLYQEEF